MSNNIPYTPDEMAGKFICCFWSITTGAWMSVQVAGGPHDGDPYLYNSIEEAQQDKCFAHEWDQIVPASEYFDMIKSDK